VKTTAVKREMKCPRRERERQDVGPDEGDASVLALCQVERGSGQIDSNGIPASGSEVRDLSSYPTPDIDRGPNLAEPSLSLGRKQLRRRSAEVPPAIDAIDVGIDHSPNDPTPVAGSAQTVAPVTCPPKR